MGAKQKVIAVLSDPSLQKISFTLDGILVSGCDFPKLINDIKKNSLTVGVDPNIRTPALFENGLQPIIRLKNDRVGDDVPSKAAIAHECAHAYLIPQVGRKLNWEEKIQHEVIGYLVEVLFLLAKSPKSTRNALAPTLFMSPATHGSEAIGQQALALVEKLDLDNKSCQVSKKDYEPLRKAIASHPMYYPDL